MRVERLWKLCIKGLCWWCVHLLLIRVVISALVSLCKWRGMSLVQVTWKWGSINVKMNELLL